MAFAKLWLLGILAAVLVVAASPPSPNPVIVRNEILAQEQQPVGAIATAYPDAATAQVAAAEERLSTQIEATRQAVQASASEAAAATAAFAERISQLERRLQTTEGGLAEQREATASAVTLAERIGQLQVSLQAAERQAAEQKAVLSEVRGTIAAPLTITWVLTALAGAGGLGAAYIAVRRLRGRGAKRD